MKIKQIMPLSVTMYAAFLDEDNIVFNKRLLGLALYETEEDNEHYTFIDFIFYSRDGVPDLLQEHAQTNFLGVFVENETIDWGEEIEDMKRLREKRKARMNSTVGDNHGR